MAGPGKYQSKGWAECASIVDRSSYYLQSACLRGGLWHFWATARAVQAAGVLFARRQGGIQGQQLLLPMELPGAAVCQFYEVLNIQWLLVHCF